MKLSDYGVWFDVMMSPHTSMARAYGGVGYEQYVVPYTLESIEKILLRLGKDTADIAVVVNGYETRNSWYITTSGEDAYEPNSLEDIKIFMRGNSIVDLKRKYKDEIK